MGTTASTLERDAGIITVAPATGSGYDGNHPQAGAGPGHQAGTLRGIGQQTSTQPRGSGIRSVSIEELEQRLQELSLLQVLVAGVG
jgi:hypothetical protein